MTRSLRFRTAHKSSSFVVSSSPATESSVFRPDVAFSAPPVSLPAAGAGAVLCGVAAGSLVVLSFLFPSTAAAATLLLSAFAATICGSSPVDTNSMYPPLWWNRKRERKKKEERKGKSEEKKRG